MRKQIFCQNLYSVVSNQVRHKPGCRATEDPLEAEISDLGSRGNTVSM